MREEASMDQLFLDKVHETIENNLANENFGVEELALEIGISRTHLHRRLNSLTGQSAGRLIKEFRLRKAKEMLQNKVATSSEIAYKVGFRSPSYFNTSFRKYFGYPPGKAKSKASFKTTKKHAIPRNYLFTSLAICLIVVLVVLNIIPRIKSAREKVEFEKAIAVLPFINDSPEKENEHFINGYMMAITDNLYKIKDLTVIARESVEQYRANPRPISEIAQVLNAAYFLCASGQKYGNTMLLTVQLVDVNSNVLWSHQYTRMITRVEDHIALQSEIAQLVAAELEAIITPEEKDRIENIPTTSMMAYELYQEGKEAYVEFWINSENTEALDRAENLYNLALEHDSTFAQVYTGLASVYLHKNYYPTYWSEEFLDTAIILANKALSFDDQLADAYIIKGNYYRNRKFHLQALDEYERALELEPNNWAAYYGKGEVYFMDDFVKSIENFHKATSLNRGKELPTILRDLAYAYGTAGFLKKAESCHKEAINLNGDSVQYMLHLISSEFLAGIIEKNIIEINQELVNTCSKYLSNHEILHELGLQYLYLHQYEESFKYFSLDVRRKEELGIPDLADLAETGYVYLKNGYTEEAEHFFNEQLNYCFMMNDLGRYYSHLKFSYIDIALVYAARGENEKAYENLRIFNQRDRMPLWAVINLKYLPLFDGMREEPEFQKIIREVEAKYQKEQERTRQWLEANDML